MSVKPFRTSLCRMLHALSVRPGALAVCTVAFAGCAAVTTPPEAEPAAQAAASAEVLAPEPTPLQQAMQAAHPRSVNLTRAKALLEGILAAGDDVSRAQHLYARTLLDQINERQRLDAANQRLIQQTKDSQQRVGELQRKIDALADIERTPPARVPKRALVR